jgi:homoserine dehydrogenase
MAHRIFIVGTGRVGNALIEQIYERGDNNPSLHQNPTEIVGVASSRSFLYSPRGLEEDTVRGFAEKRITGEPMVPFAELPGVLRGGDRVTFVDLTAESDALALHTRVIADTQHAVVTANKAPLVVADIETFDMLIRDPARYGYRCSVMAGADALYRLREYRDMNERIVSMKGSFSGTLGFITTELEKGRPFSEILQEAMRKGYTEPDPLIDLSGEDVARKLEILARTAGFNVVLGDIRREAFIEPGLVHVDKSGQLRANSGNDGFKDVDNGFKRKVERAAKSDNVLRYVASYRRNGEGLGGPSFSVKLDPVLRSSKLGQQAGLENLIVLQIEGARIAGTTEREVLTYSYSAPGAGTYVTAKNIRMDLLDQIPNRAITRRA